MQGDVGPTTEASTSYLNEFPPSEDMRVRPLHRRSKDLSGRRQPLLTKGGIELPRRLRTAGASDHFRSRGGIRGRLEAWARSVGLDNEQAQI